MATVDLIMPKMGESVAEATVIKWLKEEGDTIELDEPVLEIATDKVDSEVPSPVEGVLSKKLFNEDDVVKVGEAIALIETEGGADAPATAASEPVEAKEVEKTVSSAVETATAETTEKQPMVSSGDGNRFYSPLVRSIATEENISQTELDALPGSGKDGRVTKKDILQYVEDKKNGKASAPVAAQQPADKPAPSAPKAQPSAGSSSLEIKKPAVSLMPGDEVVEMDRMRKMIAEHMVMSKHVSPHVTSFVEADVTNLVMWRNKVKKEFAEREGEKITFTPIFIEAIVKTIKDFPNINISVNADNQLIKRKHINVGMAAALPSGNLIVPVIHDADQYNLVGLTKKVNDLARRARENKLSPDEIQGGTYTLTNVGTFGNVMGTPIINQPQVAIMAAGAIRKKPAVIETPTGDVIGVRHMMYLSHSYDHRVVDGALGGMFVRRLADYLENFDLNREL
jgi:2-oxoglutarate dehydrogenase E2 component (dihydrolipoamide succinyltransferase)